MILTFNFCAYFPPDLLYTYPQEQKCTKVQIILRIIFAIKISDPNAFYEKKVAVNYLLLKSAK